MTKEEGIALWLFLGSLIACLEQTSMKNDTLKYLHAEFDKLEEVLLK